MSVINALLRPLFDAALAPFRGLPAIVGLTVVSLVVAVAMLLVFRRVSDQEALERVKTKIQANLFEIRLFNDDLRAILRAQGEILRHNLTYFRLSLAPMLWLIVPLVLVVAQLQFHYGYRSLDPGDATLVEVELAEGWQERIPASATGKPRVELEAPEGLEVETPAVWQPEARELAWRVGAREAGAWELTVVAGDRRYPKTVRVGDDRVIRRSPVRPDRSFVEQFVYPAEKPLPAAAPIHAIRLGYPDADVWFLGFRWHWMIVFFVLTVVLAFALRKPLGVTI